MLTFPHRTLWPYLLIGLATGCMHSAPGYMGPSYPYQPQPMYAPPQQMTAPGTIVVPPSGAAPYSPGTGGSTYESNPTDTWQAPGSTGSGGSNSTGSGMFDSGSDGVPKPKDPGTNSGSGSDSPFYSDPLNQPSTQLTPGSAGAMQAHQVAVARVEAPRSVNYGFDTIGYRWLQGVLNYHDESRTWSITYNRSQNDPFLGDLTLLVDAHLVSGLQPGTAVQVQGQLDKTVLDTRGRATYRVSQIFEVPVTVAQAG